MEDRIDTYEDGRGFVSIHETDFLGNTIRIGDPLDRFTLFEADDEGRVSMTTLPNNSMVTFEYDDNNHLTRAVESTSQFEMHSAQRSFILPLG